MEIQIQSGRDIMNQWVDVTVKGGAGQLIANVTTVLDGSSLGSDDLDPRERSYQRTWHQVGTGVPNQIHVVLVTAVDDQGKQENASKTWQG
jgi:hypothetical protein